MSTETSARKFYNDLASIYDITLNGPKVDAQYMNEAERIFRKHNSDAQGTVLDLGCGTGILKELLQGELEYTGVDIAENMLRYASQRGYKTIHQSIEDALPELADCSYDFVFALTSLQFVDDIHSTLRQIERVARQSILLSLDDITEEYRQNFVLTPHNYSQVSISNAKEDYWIRGWTSLTTGITIQSRMIYMEL